MGVKCDFSLKSHWWISRRRRVDQGRYTSGQVETALPARLNAKALTEEINCSCTDNINGSCSLFVMKQIALSIRVGIS